MVDRLKGIGVDEIACLIDFGVATDAVLGQPAAPRRGPASSATRAPASRRRRDAPDGAATSRWPPSSTRHGVTHLQCTPSMARMLSLQDDAAGGAGRRRAPLHRRRGVPGGAGQGPRGAVARAARVTNMYGPDRDDDLVDDLAARRRPRRHPDRHADRQHRRSTSSTRTASRVPPGVPGELWIGGDGVVARLPRAARADGRALRARPVPRRRRTGCTAPATSPGGVSRDDGTAIVEFLGRADHQVKIRGYRIELGEIEAQLGRVPGRARVRRRRARGHAGRPAARRPTCRRPHGATIEPAAVKDRLRAHAARGHGARPRRRARRPARTRRTARSTATPCRRWPRCAARGPAPTAPVAAGNDLEREVLAVWEETLGTDRHRRRRQLLRHRRPLAAGRAHAPPAAATSSTAPIALTDLYRFPTVRGFAASLSAADVHETVTDGHRPGEHADRAARSAADDRATTPDDAERRTSRRVRERHRDRRAGRPPPRRARRRGVLGATCATASRASASSPTRSCSRPASHGETLRRPGLRARAAHVLDGVDDFDAEFFGFSPEGSGDHGPAAPPLPRWRRGRRWRTPATCRERFDGAIGVFAGCGIEQLLHVQPAHQPGPRATTSGLFLLRHTGNDKDFLATRASYLFDLRGPCVNVQTACSTSLVAIHLAVPAPAVGRVRPGARRRRHDRDPARPRLPVPGGRDPLPRRPLPRLRPPLARARSSAAASASSRCAGSTTPSPTATRSTPSSRARPSTTTAPSKVGYLAPSVDGQAACVAEALGVADVDPETISYVECHGTGTPMGDPIEIAALTQAFRAGRDKTGLLPASAASRPTSATSTRRPASRASSRSRLALRHGELPPSLNFEADQPAARARARARSSSTTRSTEWRREGSTPRRAGVNSLGVGGTNAFAVLEEAPGPPPHRRARPLAPAHAVGAQPQARSTTPPRRLGAHLRDHPDLDLADVAWTLQRRPPALRRASRPRRARPRRGRRAARAPGPPARVHPHGRHGGRAVASPSCSPAAAPSTRGWRPTSTRAEPVFAEHVDAGLRAARDASTASTSGHCCSPSDADRDAAAAALRAAARTSCPAIFIVEYALAAAADELGHRADARWSATASVRTPRRASPGTMSFDDCLGLVVLRGRLMDASAAAPSPCRSPPTSCAAARRARPRPGRRQRPDLSVVSGAVARARRVRGAAASIGRRAPARRGLNVAAHSRLLDPILPEFRAYLESIDAAPADRSRGCPTAPARGSPTSEATDPGYWVEHLRHTVRFADCIATLAADPDRVLLEVGPGKTLSSLARMNPDAQGAAAGDPDDAPPRRGDRRRRRCCSPPSAGCGRPACARRRSTRLFGPATPRRRVALPDLRLPDPAVLHRARHPARGRRRADARFLDRDAGRGPVVLGAGLEEPGLRRAGRPTRVSGSCSSTTPGVGDDGRRAAARPAVTTSWSVRSGDSYQSRLRRRVRARPGERPVGGYEALVRDLVRTGRIPDRIAHLALLADDDRAVPPGQQLLPPQPGARLPEPRVPRPGVGVGRRAAAAAHRRGDDGRPARRRRPTSCRGPSRPRCSVRCASSPASSADVTVSAFDIDQADLSDDSRCARAALAGLSTAPTACAAQRGSSARRATLRRGLGRRAMLAELPRRPQRRGRPARRSPLRAGRPARRGSPTDGEPRLRARRRRAHHRRPRRHRPDASPSTSTTPHDARLALLSADAAADAGGWDDVARAARTPTTPRAGASPACRRSRRKGAEVLLARRRRHRRRRRCATSSATRARALRRDPRRGPRRRRRRRRPASSPRPQSEMDDVLAPKVYGTLVLDEATRDDDLDLFVVFSSTSTVTAPDRPGRLRRRQRVPQRVRREPARRPAATRSSRSTGASGTRSAWPPTAAARVRRRPRRRSRGRPCEHPFVRRAARSTADGVARLDVTLVDHRAEWFLDEHRTAAGEALVARRRLPRARPGRARRDRRRPAVRDPRPHVPPSPRRSRRRARRGPDGADPDGGRATGSRSASGSSSATPPPRTARDRGRPRLAARRRSAAAAPRAVPVPALDLDVAAVAACTEREPVRTHQQDHLRFGPRWDVVERVQRGDRRVDRLARLAGRVPSTTSTTSASTRRSSTSGPASP